MTAEEATEALGRIDYDYREAVKLRRPPEKEMGVVPVASGNGWHVYARGMIYGFNPNPDAILWRLPDPHRVAKRFGVESKFWWGPDVLIAIEDLQHTLVRSRIAHWNEPTCETNCMPQEWGGDSAWDRQISAIVTAPLEARVETDEIEHSLEQSWAYTPYLDEPPGIGEYVRSFLDIIASGGLPKAFSDVRRKRNYLPAKARIE